MSRAVPKLRGAGARGIAARVVAAVPLNYAVTSALTMLVARLLPGDAAQASIGATTLSFAIFAGLAMTAFAVRSVAKLWLGLVATGLVAGAADWALIAVGGRL
ncbi:hypothetical protein OVY29_03615 [Sphingopyxis sp. SE2]|jgi:hypothetical protein|uniref:hypothetical protein n=1 Tax=unclassified Sphingopyxis TaxID=2614943 RepID=UPI000510674E|nr:MULTISPECIES: hypothetical protein [unclassified Sphingopyxis]KGB53761.1 putative iron uptake protein [Sphingopyxis sp. LC363]MDT7527752.1 hypothetical protein [Sphingopyxis sp. SE2]